MDAFIQKYQPLIVSTFYLIFGLVLAGYSVFYSRLEVYSHDLSKAREEIRSLNQDYKKRDEARLEASKKDEKASDVGIRYLPTFLDRINKIAHQNAVIIRKLTPARDNPLKFNLEFITDYFTFIHFSFGLESLDIILDDIQIHVYDPSKVPPLHAISFSLIPRNDAQPLGESERMAVLKTQVDMKEKRNPFQRLVGLREPGSGPLPTIDLTWLYKLGGLGLMPDRQPYATIDQRNYLVGEKLDGRVITEIGKDRLYLEKVTPEGKARFLLTFRKRKKKSSP